MAKHNTVGSIGEDVATRYLEGKSFEIIERNYRKKWGELDIVARETSWNRETLHFVEVKTVSREISSTDISRETSDFSPEEMVHSNKIARLKRAIQTYLLDRNVPRETEWEFSIIAVFLDQATKKAVVRHTKNIVL
ncbi:MAG: YraN family protein [Patescibacteria group bacterium]